MIVVLGALAGVLAVAETVVVCAFLVARDRQEQRHHALLANVEGFRQAERTELLQRIQAPQDATSQYAPYEPPTEPQHISVFDDEAMLEQLNG